MRTIKTMLAGLLVAAALMVLVHELLAGFFKMTGQCRE